MTRLILAAFAVMSAGAAAAAEPQIESVTITARVPAPVGSEVFSGARLQAEDLRGVPQLDAALAQVPGLSLFRRNSSLSANPTTQGVSLRSIAPSGAGRALVTLDGVPQNDPFGGWVIWSALPPEGLASAEIVRGAGAGPYGAGALTGIIALAEREDTALVADAFWGERESSRVAAAGGVGPGSAILFGSAAWQSSAGWIPVDAAQRGPADDAVTLNAFSASARFQANLFAGTSLATRIGIYRERRHSGLVGAGSRASGVSASATLAHPAGEDLGWRLQAWLRDTDFANSSAGVAPARAFTTPSNDQYETPARGWGANAALRGSAFVDWEAGADLRIANGESRENFQFASGAYQQNRISGGRSFVGGVYAEAARRMQQWLFTAGARIDEWRSSDGHLVQRSRATGAVSLTQSYPERSGTVPTARGGIRRDFQNGFHLRGAGYAGFRAPSLNELYRPFRLGNNITLANAALKPERLNGVEIGTGQESESFDWNATVFFNRLESAITNVTIGQGPGTFPGAGFVPAGGLLIQRRNAGAIDALGFEGEAHYRMENWLELDAALAVVDAEVDGGSDVPTLTGKRPSQAPMWTVTGGVRVLPVSDLTLDLQARYESVRFADDQNTLRLPAALRVNARASWQFLPGAAVYVAADNLFDEAIATTRGGDGIVSYDAPRMLRLGLSYAM